MDRRKVWVAGAALLLAGCMEEHEPLGLEQEPGPEAPQGALTCEVNVRGGSLSCTPMQPKLPAGASGVVIGGQGINVLLESTNVSYDDVSEVFSADVTVRNLLTQALGTTDGSTIDPDGVRVFFHTLPAVTVGSGVVTVKNADGTAVFTALPAPYFQYDQVLSPGKISLPRNWQWDVPASVETFTFTVYVSAAAAAEQDIEAGLSIDAKTIGAGEVYSCGLTVSGAAYCWGSGGWGQLGNNDNEDQATPVAVRAPAGASFASISTGTEHACAITTAGTAYCWGRSTDHRLGNGSLTFQFQPSAVKAPAGVTFVSIDAGTSSSCGVTSAGVAYCWGSAALGSDASTPRGTPVAVDAPAGVTFASISVGEEHACAVTTSGTAYCWGSNAQGQLGNPASGGSSLTPVAVAAPAGVTFVSISAGTSHTCAITPSGAAYCWGEGGYGQLGNGSFDNQSLPQLVSAPGGRSFASISAGRRHTCAIASTGAAYCWGEGAERQIGNGGSSNYSTPVAVTAPPGAKFVAIAAGRSHTCATTAAGAAYCWGTNNSGEIGNGSSNFYQTTPGAVSNITNFAWLNLPVDPAPTRSAFTAYALGGQVLSSPDGVCPAVTSAAPRHA